MPGPEAQAHQYLPVHAIPHPPHDKYSSSGYSVSQNANKERTSFKGIRYRRELDRYISEIRPAQPKKRKIWLGTYRTEEEAARAFDAGIYYTGKNLAYNFDDSPSILEPLREGLTQEEQHIEIQKKAKAAASRHQVQHRPARETKLEQEQVYEASRTAIKFDHDGRENGLRIVREIRFPVLRD